MKNSLLYIGLIFIAFDLSGQKYVNLYLKGTAELSFNRYDSAIIYLTGAIKSDPLKVNFYLKRGEAYYKSEKYTEAINDFSYANQLKDNIADLWLAKTYARMGNTVESVSMLKKHLNSEYREPEKTIKSDEAFDEVQYSDEWFLLWQQEWYTEEEKLSKDIDYLQRKKEYLEALNLIDSKLANSSKSEILFTYRAKISVLQGNYKAAAMDLTNAIEKNKDNPNYYKERGIAYMNTGKFKEAVGDFSKALKLEPSDFNTYILRGKAYNEAKDFSSAEKDISTYLDYFPEDQSAINLAGELCYSNQNYIGALKYFNKNLRLDGTRADYFKARGKTYLRIKMNKYAFDDLSMALDLNPDDGETWYYKGLVRFQSGDKQGACDDWNKALKKGYTNAVEEIIKNCQ